MREKAKEILLDNMSDDTADYLSKIDHLQGWIIDAMIEYNKSVLIEIGADIRNKLTPPLNLCDMVEKLDSDTKLINLILKEATNTRVSIEYLRKLL